MKRFNKTEQNYRPIILKKDENLYEFRNTTEAAQWIIDNNYSRTKNVVNVRRKVAYAILYKELYLGFYIYEKEE